MWLKNGILLSLAGVALIVLLNIFFMFVNLFASGREIDFSKELVKIISLIFCLGILVGLIYYFYTSDIDEIRTKLTSVFETLKSNRVPLLIGLGLSGLGLITLGAPGGLLITLHDWIVPVINKVLGWELRTFSQKHHGDAIWPTAITISLVWPWAVLIISKGLSLVWGGTVFSILSITSSFIIFCLSLLFFL